ncbi:hypothetical protein FPV67DRAFT_1665418 [Lyophyllum atratum]|nr:hypothetical protein FPV67DRAFT_1665418 [Lyophyllum atratum]
MACLQKLGYTREQAYLLLTAAAVESHVGAVVNWSESVAEAFEEEVTRPLAEMSTFSRNSTRGSSTIRRGKVEANVLSAEKLDSRDEIREDVEPDYRNAQERDSEDQELLNYITVQRSSPPPFPLSQDLLQFSSILNDKDHPVALLAAEWDHHPADLEALLMEWAHQEAELQAGELLDQEDHPWEDQAVDPAAEGDRLEEDHQVEGDPGGGLAREDHLVEEHQEEGDLEEGDLVGDLAREDHQEEGDLVGDMAREDRQEEEDLEEGDLVGDLAREDRQEEGDLEEEDLGGGQAREDHQVEDHQEEADQVGEQAQEDLLDQGPPPWGPPVNPPKPPTDGPKPPIDGPKPPTDGPKPPTDGPKPPTDGPKPPTDGPKPPTDGPKPPVDGPKPPTDGPKPPTDGPKPPVDGPKPPTDGPKPPTDGPKPPTDGPKPPTDGPKPPTDGPKPPTDGPKPPTDGPKPPTDGPKPPTDWPKPPTDGPKPPTDGPKPPTDGPKPPTDGPKPPTDGPKPPVNCPKPPVDCSKPPVDCLKPPVDCSKPPVDVSKPPVDSPTPTYNLKNIQGDILPSLPKALEYFYYFEITNLAKFRDTFGMFIVPKITTSHQIASNPQLPPPGTPGVTFLGLNVGFTHLALQMFGMTGNLLDDSFEKGQQQDSKSLGDAGTQRGNFWTPQWDAEYKADIHGIFLITAYEDAIAAKFVADMEKAFSYTASRMSIKKVVLLKATPRPKPEDRNDHFGYRGGMSNPQIRGASFETTQVPKIRYPGSPIIPIGVIVMGYDGDEDKDKRPAWAKDGSFMVTRKLNNLVPEFDEFLLLHGPKIFLNISAKDAADRLGARLFGRWKDGTPTELSPDGPNPDISGKDDKVNNFVFDQSKGQTRCPFASHVRKSNPRNDVSPIESAYKHFIRRHNMPYGQEITAEEREGKSTIFERGLHVVCYASSIVRGFKFYQQAWYNEPNFPPGKSELPGQDPIFGQTGQEHLDNHRYMTGTNPTAEQQVMMFPKKFIDVKGGEYFFAPSISTMRDMIATQVYLG